MRQLGKAVSILLEESKRNGNAYEYEDLSAFHAPSEFYGDVARGQARRFRQVRRRACHMAGVKTLRQLRREVKKVCPTWDRYNYSRLGIDWI
jgi:hypothetical protein